MGKKSQRAVSAFNAHVIRYLEAYLPDSGFEFAITNRYVRSIDAIPNAASLYDASAIAETSATGAARSASLAASASAASPEAEPKKKKARLSNHLAAVGQTGLKKDLCVVAVRAFQPGEIIQCKGGLKDLTREQDEALRAQAAMYRTGLAHENASASARDFSIIRSTRRNVTQVLLGPARFVNHDCEPNAAFHKTGPSMTFRAVRPIRPNEEILVLYGEHYFGTDNCECLCATCEKRGKGVYSRVPPPPGDAPESVPMISTIDSATGHSSDAEDATGGGGGAQNVSIHVKSDSSGGAAGSSEGDVRRAPSKRIKSAASGRQSPNGSSAGSSNGRSTSPISRNDSALLKALSQYKGEDRVYYPASPVSTGLRAGLFPSDREIVDPEKAEGKFCQCKTCAAPFFSAEWYGKDECIRCERHFAIYQADYPHRAPTEEKWRIMLERHAAKMAARNDGKSQKRKVWELVSEDEDEGVGDDDGDGAVRADAGSRSPKKKSKGKEGGAAAKGRKSGGEGAAKNATSRSKKKVLPRESSDEAAGASQTNSPIRLTPLRPVGAQGDAGADGAEEDAAVCAPGKRRPNKQQPRKSVADMDTDEDFIEQTLSSSSAAGPNKVVNDSDSELSDPPASCAGSVKGLRLSSVPMSANPSVESALSTESATTSSVSSSEERPRSAGMLGKFATQPALAEHWGIKPGEDTRRIRKPSVNGPVSLASRVGSSVGKKPSGHRRTPSTNSLPGGVEGVGSSPLSVHRKKEDSRGRSESREASIATRSPSKPNASLHSARRASAGAPPTIPAPNRSGSTSADGAIKAESTTADTPPPALASASASASAATPAPRPSSSKRGSGKIRDFDPPTPSSSSDTDGTPLSGPQRTSNTALSNAWGAGETSGRTRSRNTREPSLLSALHRGASPALQQRRSSRGGGGDRGGSSGASGGARTVSKQRGIKKEDSVGLDTAASSVTTASRPETSSAGSSRSGTTASDAPSPQRDDEAPAPAAAADTSMGESNSSTGPRTNGSNGSGGLGGLPPHSPSGPAHNGLAPGGSLLSNVSNGSPNSSHADGGPKHFTQIPGRRNLRIKVGATSSRPLAAATTGAATNGASMSSTAQQQQQAVPTTSAYGWPGVVKQSSSPMLTSQGRDENGIGRGAASTAASTELLPAASVAEPGPPTANGSANASEATSVNMNGSSPMPLQPLKEENVGPPLPPSSSSTGEELAATTATHLSVKQEAGAGGSEEQPEQQQRRDGGESVVKKEATTAAHDAVVAPTPSAGEASVS